VDCNSRITPDRLLPTDTTTTEIVAVIELDDDFGIDALARSIIRHFHIIGVIEDMGFYSTFGKTIMIWRIKPVLDIKQHLESD